MTNSIPFLQVGSLCVLKPAYMSIWLIPDKPNFRPAIDPRTEVYFSDILLVLGKSEHKPDYIIVLVLKTLERFLIEEIEIGWYLTEFETAIDRFTEE